MAKKTTGTPAPPRTPAAPRRRSTSPAKAPRATASEPAAAPNDLPTVAPTDQPSHDDIAHAAYLRYLNRGGGDGQDFEDWLHAERELKQRRNGE